MPDLDQPASAPAGAARARRRETRAADAAARRVVKIRAEIVSMRDLVPDLQHDVDRATPGTQRHADMLVRLTKARKTMSRLTADLDRALAAAGDSTAGQPAHPGRAKKQQPAARAVTTAADRTAGKATPAKASGGKATPAKAAGVTRKTGAPATSPSKARSSSPNARPAVSEVRVRRVVPTPVPEHARVCSTCHTWAPLHTREQLCGSCLRAQDRTPCHDCGQWLESKQTKKHSCREAPSSSVQALQGGAPGLGRR